LIKDIYYEHHKTVGHLGSGMAYITNVKAGDKFSSQLQNVNVDLVLIK
jgi:hypothetical protein